MLHTRAAAVVVALLSAVLMAGCSSASSSSGPVPGSGPSGGSGASGNTWTIGAVSDCSGATASSLGGTCQTLTAWADSVNASGGIDGHKINFISLDDAGNPATAIKQVHQLIQQDHVIAITGPSTSYSSVWGSYAASMGIPVIGGTPLGTDYLTNPDFYSIGLNLLAIDYAATKEAALHGYHKLGYLYCAESPACAQSVPLFTGSAQMVASTAVLGKVAATAPSYTAQCLALKNAGVNAYEIGDASDVVLRIIDQCVQQGLKAKIIGVDGGMTNAWTKDANTNGLVGVELVTPWFETSVPAIQQYRAAMQKYAPSVYNSALFGPDTSYAWDSAMLFEAAAKAAHLGNNPTAAQVKQGLYALKNETLGGLTVPLNFTVGKPSVNLCYIRVTIQNGEFKTPDGNTPQCIPAKTIAPLMKGF